MNTHSKPAAASGPIAAAVAAETARTGGWARFRQGMSRVREQAEQRRGRPGHRGWTMRGGGRATWVTPPNELEGTSNHVCGLWPFSVGVGLPTVGVPLGPHQQYAGTVCADPISWYLAGFLSNPSAFILGLPALGKSSLLRHICVILPAWGILPIILSDTKGEHVELVRSIEGQVIPVGRGLNAINVLDLGPLVTYLDALPPELRNSTLEDLRARRMHSLKGLLELVMHASLNTVEANVLNAVLRHLDREPHTPVMGDVREMIEDRHRLVRDVVRDRGDDSRYDDRMENLLDALRAVDSGGQFGDIFSRHTTLPIEMEKAVVFDMHTVEDTDLELQAALQLVCWAYASSVVQSAKVLAEAGLRPERHYVMVMDELWRMLRASPLMVDPIDSLTRLNRNKALGQIMVTHTMNDLKLATEAATLKAWGFVERSAMVFLGGLSAQEMGNLATVFKMSQREMDQLEEWTAEGGYDESTGQSAAPPGRGKFLLKIGSKPGVPFQVALSPLGDHLHKTDSRWAGLRERRLAGRGEDDVA
ncbi:MAG: hypothetical protein WA892_13090 [Ornithinimicrobium sp.]